MMHGQEIGIVWFNGLQSAEYPMKDRLRSLMIVHLGRCMAFLPDSDSESNGHGTDVRNPKGGVINVRALHPFIYDMGVLSCHCIHDAIRPSQTQQAYVQTASFPFTSSALLSRNGDYYQHC